jgi:hypothetical protein
MSDPVQFFGKDQVMQEVEERNCPAWAIFIRRNLYRKYEGDSMTESLDMLSHVLDNLSASGTEALHLIKFYESDRSGGKKINESTKCDAGSFTFKIVDPEERQAKQLGYINNQANIIAAKKMWDLEQANKELKQAVESKDDSQSIGDIARDYLQRPDELAQLINIGRVLLGYPVANFPNASIGRVTRAGTEDQPAAENELEKNLDDLGEAVDILAAGDPKFVARLQKIARMKKENPDQYNSFLSILDLQ